MAEPKRKRRWRWIAGGIAALILALVAVWYSGYPQRKAAEWALERNTGLIADVAWGGEFPELRIDHVYLYANRDAKRRKAPLLSAFNVNTQYSLLASGRKVKRVRIGKLLVDADPYAEELRELPLFKKVTATADSKVGKSSTTFIPREMLVDELTVRLHSEDSMFLLLDSLQVNADLADPAAAQIVVQSKPALFVYTTPDGVDVRVDDVVVDGRGSYVDGRLAWKQTIASEGLMRLAFEVSGPLTGDAAHVDVTVGEGEVAGDGVRAFLHSLKAPVQFDSFAIANAAARVGLGESVVSTLASAARVYGLRLADADEALYPEVVSLALNAEHGETTTATATLEFARGQVARATLQGTSDSGEIRAEIPAWTHAEMVNALPVAFREGVAGVRFDTFTTNATVRWTPETYTIDAHAESKGGGASAEPIVWAVQASGAREGDDQAIEGTAEARIGDRRVTASARYEGADHYIAEAVIEEVQIAPWVELVAGDEMAASISGTIQGKIHAEAKGQDAPLHIQPDLTLKAFQYDTIKLDEITAKGSMEYAQSEGRFTISQLRAEAPDGITALELAGWEYETGADVGGGGIVGGADLGLIGQLIDQPDLVGTATMEGTVRIVGDRKEIDFTLSSDYLGLGELLLPYGSKAIGEGNIEYNADADSLILRGFAAKVGDGTNVRLSESRFTTSPLSGGGTLTLESDMQVLVGMEMLQEVQGTFALDAKFGFVNEALRADWTGRMGAAKLVLPGNVGFAEGVAFAANGTYQADALVGSGDIKAAKISAAGGSINNAEGPVLFDGELMRVQQAKGELFRGEIRADIDIGVLQEGMPIVLDGTFEGADLAIFTDEVKPPDTQLTGTAQGRVSAEYASNALHSFSFEAVSPGKLSVNRSLVEDLLQTDKFLSGAGANIAAKAMDKLLGTAPQRPFDRGQISAQLQDDKITGLALLESVKTKEYNGLNLRITLDMDQSALAEALKLLQETSTTTVDF